MRDYKSIQTLASIALIGGPVSLLIGGVLLSTASLVCGIIALAMLRKIEGDRDAIAQSLMRQAIIGVGVSGVALIMNAVALASILPAVMDALQTGDYTALLGGGADGTSSGSSSSGNAFGSGSGNGSGSASDATGTNRSSVWG